jgi:hypothetical protein
VKIKDGIAVSRCAVMGCNERSATKGTVLSEDYDRLAVFLVPSVV